MSGRTVYGDAPMNTTHISDSTANTATSTIPAAYYYRNEPLTGADNISTTDPQPTAGGTTLGKWTMR
jgi:hypothetical protein